LKVQSLVFVEALALNVESRFIVEEERSRNSGIIGLIMSSPDHAAEGGEGHGSNNENPPGVRVRVSVDNAPPTIIEGADGDGDGGEDNDDGEEEEPPEPLYRSSRLKGYMTLLVSALYNYFAASDKYHGRENGAKLPNNNICLDNFLTSIGHQPYTDDENLPYTMATSMATVVITSLIILCHFDFCTPLRKNVWPKAFGPSARVELVILLFLTIFWLINTWFNTTIRGPGGNGKDQHNLYFSSWICTWASIWTLERWCTCSGRASFERFIRSWPNRCPLWIVTFILSFFDFMFVLDTYRHWKEGSKYSPYVYKLFSEVDDTQWALLFFVTATTFLMSLSWALAEIFRENVKNVGNVKSDVEFYVEGLMVHAIAIIWICTVCIVTMPGGAASLIGNLYFTTWSTLISVIATLIWFISDWRKMILDIIQEQQDQYDSVKRRFRKREEERLARLAEEGQVTGEMNPSDDAESSKENAKEFETEEDDEGILCEDDPVNDDITISIASGWQGTSSSPDHSERKNAPVDAVDSGVKASSLFLSAISMFFTGAMTDDQQPAASDDSSLAKEKAAEPVTSDTHNER